MTPGDEDALARLRAALHTIADRTPISGGRLDEISVAATEKRTRPTVTIVSAAAAVAAIAAVSAVVVGTHSDASRAILPGSGGSQLPTLSPTLSPWPIASPVASPVASSTPWALAAPGVVASSATGCVPENYNVIASPSEVTGLTYMLPATPAGYRLYGAWGTISRNQCADSVTWYVEYDQASGPAGSGGIQLTVTRVGGDSLAGGFASATPVAATSITVNGIQGFVFGKDSSYATIGWTTGGAAITVAAPLSNGDIASLVHVADSLVLLSADDSRIVAPADCQVPPGSTCPSDSPTPSPSPSSAANPTATASPSSTSVPSGGSAWTANPIASPTPSPTAG